jgi:hypothetical protein
MVTYMVTVTVPENGVLAVVFSTTCSTKSVDTHVVNPGIPPTQLVAPVEVTSHPGDAVQLVTTGVVSKARDVTFHDSPVTAETEVV